VTIHPYLPGDRVWLPADPRRSFMARKVRQLAVITACSIDPDGQFRVTVRVPGYTEDEGGYRHVVAPGWIHDVRLDQIEPLDVVTKLGELGRDR